MKDKPAGSFLFEGSADVFTKMDLSPFTLSFKDGREKRFLDRYYHDSLFQFRVSFVLVTLLYGFFHFLDSLMVPEHRHIFFLIRFGVVVPFLSLVLLLSFFNFFRKVWQLLIFFSLLIGGVGIALMLVKVPDNFVYYGGMMLIFSAGYFFIKLRFYLGRPAGHAHEPRGR